jgi:general secretion pathway protein L
MSFINTQKILLWPKLTLARLNFRYDAFAELAIGPQTELNFLPDRFQLFVKSHADRSLPETPSETWALDEVAPIAILRRDKNIVLSIDESLCFVHKFEIPSLALNNIGSIINFELLRITPFLPEQVILGWQQASKNVRAGHIEIKLYVIRREAIRPALDVVENANALVRAIIVRANGMPGKRFVILVDGTSFGAKRFRNWTKILAVSLAVFAACGVLALAAIERHFQKRVANFDEQISHFEKDAKFVSLQLAHDQVIKAKKLAFVNRQQGKLNRIAIIEELSKLLPDDTYIDAMNISSDGIKIDGAAQSPEQLVPLLESSPLFQNVVFAAPNYRNPGETKSRFSLKFEIAPASKSR